MNRYEFYQAVDGLFGAMNKQAAISPWIGLGGAALGAAAIPGLVGAFGDRDPGDSRWKSALYAYPRMFGSTLVPAIPGALLTGAGLLAGAKLGPKGYIAPATTLIGAGLGSMAGAAASGLTSAYDQNTPWWKPGLVGAGIGAGIGGLAGFGGGRLISTHPQLRAEAGRVADDILSDLGKLRNY